MRKVPKILCHSDGAIFANWQSKGVYVVYMSDLDAPPAPETLQINSRSFTDLRLLVWCPVIQVVQYGDDPAAVDVTGPYDSETGEGV